MMACMTLPPKKRTAARGQVWKLPSSPVRSLSGRGREPGRRCGNYHPPLPRPQRGRGRGLGGRGGPPFHRVAATHALPATVSLTIEEFPVFFLASPILPRSLPPRERTGGWGEGAEVGGKCRGWGKVQGLVGRCGGYHPPLPLLQRGRGRWLWGR